MILLPYTYLQMWVDRMSLVFGGKPVVVLVPESRNGLQSADSGQDLVEFALALPFLLILLFGIIEFALVVLSYNTISNAAREGARYAIISPENESGDCAAPAGAIGTAVCRLVSGLDVSQIDYQAVYSGQTMTVQITYEYHFITAPIMMAVGLGSTINLASEATMQVE